MGFGHKPKRPKYEEQADTPWITRNRDMNQWSYDNIQRNINRVNVFDDATRRELNDYNDAIYNRAANDLNRNYLQTMNDLYARDYNRFGTTGASTSLLNRDNYNLQQQRALTDLAYDKAINYENMIDKELARRYNFLNTNYGYFTNSGNTIQNFDNANWQIRNTNKDIQYLNDVQKYNSKMNLFNSINKVGSAALSFIPGVGPILGAGASALGDSLFAPVNVSGSSPFGIYNNSGVGYIGGDTDWSALGNALSDYNGSDVNIYGGSATDNANALNNLANALKGGVSSSSANIQQFIQWLLGSLGFGQSSQSTYTPSFSNFMNNQDYLTQLYGYNPYGTYTEADLINDMYGNNNDFWNKIRGNYQW